MKKGWNEVLKRCDEKLKEVSSAELNLPEGVAIYGAGFLGKWVAKYLKKKGANVLYFVDSDQKKWGAKVDGITVVSPDDPIIKTSSVTFIVAKHAVPEIQKKLSFINNIVISFNAYFVVQNLERISHVRNNLLSDEKSRETIDSVLLFLLTDCSSFCSAVMEGNQYFSLPIFSNINEIYVDAGAYTGDTIERFIWANSGVFKHIYAFEPGSRQFIALQHRMARLIREWAFDESCISLINAGLSSTSEEIACAHSSGLLSALNIDVHRCHSSDTKAVSVKVYALDNYLSGREVTFIKADVEGMEMDLLRGSQNTIREFKPKMALSVYHYPPDIYEIAEYIHTLVPDYQFALRHHSPICLETVLYCWINK